MGILYQKTLQKQMRPMGPNGLPGRIGKMAGRRPFEKNKQAGQNALKRLESFLKKMPESPYKADRRCGTIRRGRDVDGRE